ncbi:MAG TPA: LPD38 domain-containing protein [Brevundimonas sp.]|jgi:hypothetical protein|uniref:LPD38 domain-containing protein n=1 Tax=Brevundimonas sp. TaxID=1871086 RepID=UPI002E0F1B8E|nr:LPD38 domain-containing protein [Brevundimonas sp.]
MSERQQALAEAYRRGIMQPEQKAAYEEAMRRGLVQGPERSLGQRFMDNAAEGFGRSIFGAAARSLDSEGDGLLNVRDLTRVRTDTFLGRQFDRALDATVGENRRWFEGVSRADTVASRRERQRRELYSARAAADPIDNPAEFGAFLAGQVAGGGLSPENIVGGGVVRGGSLAVRLARGAGQQALIAGAVDAGLQVSDINAGIQDEFSAAQTGGAALLGGGISLTFGLARPVADTVRRAYTDRVPPRVEPVSDGPGSRTTVEIDGETVVDVRSGSMRDTSDTPVIPARPDNNMDVVVPLERRGMIAEGSRIVKERRAGRAIADWFARRYTDVIDARHPLTRLQSQMQEAIEAATGSPLDIRPGDDAAKLARAGFDAYNIGMQNILHGVHGYRKLAPETPALADALTAVVVRETRAGAKPEAALQMFDQYLVARRAVIEWDRFAKGELENPPLARTREQAEAFIARMDSERPELRELSDQINQYASGLLKLRLDSGLISRETYDAALAGRDFYVPFRREMDDRPAGVSRSGANAGPEVKQFRGSDRNILSPVEVLAQDSLRLAQRVRQNDINRSIVSMAKRLNALSPDGENPFMRKVKAPMRKTVVANDELAAQARGTRDDVDALFDDDVEVWRPGEVNANGRPIIYVWENGQREAWELLDPEWGQLTYEAITNMTPAQADVFGAIVGAVTNFVARTVTTTPDFILANLIRDQVASAAYVRGFVPGEGLAGSVDEAVSRATGRVSEAGRLYNVAGGISGGATTAQMSELLIRQDALELTRRGWKARYFEDSRGFLRAFEDVARWTELTEVGNRRTVFQKVLKRMKAEGFDDWDAITEAAFASRDLIDFGRKGSRVHGAVRVFMFLNPYLQGLDKLVRTAITDPASAVGRAHAAGGKEAALKAIVAPLFQGQAAPGQRVADRQAIQAAARAWTTMAAIGAFGLSLSAMFMDDPEYQQANEMTRSTHWIIPVGDYIVKVPKPFELAWMSNVLERWWEATNAAAGEDAEVAWGRMWNGVGTLFAPPTSIPLLAGATGLATGVDPRTGRPIVSESLEALPPQQQYNAWTSNFATWLGENTGMSPAYIDYVIRTFGGPIGTYALAAGDAADPDRPSGSWVDAPVVRRFVTPSFRGSQDKRDFYARAGARTSELERALNGVESFMDMGRLANAERDLAALDESGRLYVLSQLGEVATKRLHPLARAKVVGTEASRMIGELNGALPKDDGVPLPAMSRNRRQMVEDALERVALAEMRNAMIASNQPGFQGRAMMDRDAMWSELNDLAPEVAAEFDRRLATGRDRTYSYEAVMTAWPEAQRRLQAEGTAAYLDDLADSAAASTPLWGDRIHEEDELPVTLRF